MKKKTEYEQFQDIVKQAAETLPDKDNHAFLAIWGKNEEDNGISAGISVVTSDKILLSSAIAAMLNEYPELFPVMMAGIHSYVLESEDKDAYIKMVRKLFK